MIRHIALSNFKAFGPEQQIPLRPITLIFGKNSSGKSSIIHALLLAHHVQQKENWHVGNPKLSGDSVDLGGFHNYVHRQNEKDEKDVGEPRKLTLKLECRVQPTPRRHPILAQSSRLKLNLYVSAKGNEWRANDVERKLPKLMRCEVEIDGQLLLHLAREEEDEDHPKPVLQLKHWNHDHPLSQQYVQTCLKAASVPEAKTEIIAAVQKMMRECWSTADLGDVSFLPNRVTCLHESPIDDTDLTPTWQTAPDPLERLSGFISQRFPHHLGKLFAELHDCFAEQLNRINYLGPLRTLPARFLPETDSNDPNWKSGGAFAWHQLMSDKSLRDKVNVAFERMSVPYFLQVGRLADEHAVLEKLEQYLREFYLPRILKQIANDEDNDFDTEGAASGAWDDIKLRLTDVRSELKLIDRNDTPVTHRDVGIGISQMLPVLVHAVASENKLIAIEQPEIHLHPAMQAELGDVFIESALRQNGNQFIIETHSEHLILRILRRIRETTAGKDTPVRITPEDVAVLYVKPGVDGSEIVELKVDEHGRFKDNWPSGFFEERLDELF
jgi:AAA ATPase domain/Protein of unknown function (DUF3696)